MATFTGTAGNDTIKGTTGADEMTGLAGNDTYTVDHCDDEVVEAPAGGTDTVFASHLFKLSDNVENLTLTGSAATDGYGNDENNVINGNSGPNLLVAGAGIDTVNGGDGNDVLVLAENLTAADKLDGGKGFDTLRLDGDYAAGVAFAASTMANVEQVSLADGNDYKLTLVDGNNTSSLLIDGSLLTGTNTLNLDASAETASALTALGGEGDDTLTGGGGADSFTGGKGADIITGGLGSDTVNYDGSATGVTIDLTSAAAQSGGDAAGDKLSGIENAVGSAVADTLTGTGGNNKLSGGAGNDTITAGAGDDVVLGGDGDDALAFGANLTKTDFIDGGDGEDALSIAGNYAAGFTFDAARFKNLESVVLGAGFDYKLVLTDGANAVGFTVDGSALGAGDDLNLSGAAETFAPLTATGGAGNDTILGGGGNDILTAGAGVDILTANKGDDTFVMKANLTAADKIDGGIGNDTLVLDGDYSAGLTFGKTTAINLESIVVTDGKDYKLTLDNATNGKSLLVDGRELTGGSQLNVNGAAETTNTFALFGGAGADTLTGGGGNDTLVGGAGADVMDGGKGSADVVTYAAAGSAIGFGTKNTGDGAGDVLSNVEIVIGSEFDDYITGDATINRVEGGFGNDTIESGAGVDKLLGGANNDVFLLGANLTAADQVDGGDNTDVAILDGNYAAGVVFTKTTMLNVESIGLADGNSYKLTLADDTNKNGLYVDGIFLTGANTLNLNAAAEKSASLTAVGGAANDTIVGGNGNDELVGSAGDDQLSGNGGDDLLTGGAGKDVLNGGAGNDTASYEDSALAVQVSLAVLTAQVSTGDASGDKISAVENLRGSGWDDVLTGNALGNRLEGGVGADTINGGAGIDLASYASSTAVTVDLTLDGVAQAGAGDSVGDVLNADIEGIAGSAFGDELIGDNNNNVLEGAGGSDTITAGLGVDKIDGGSGSDRIVFDANLTAADVIIGGSGTDTVALSAAAAYAAGLVLGKTSFSGVEVLELGDGNNYRITLNDANADGALTVDGSALTGKFLVLNGAAETSADLTVLGGDGNDTLTGGKGDDTLAGGAGADSLTGGNGFDAVSYANSAAGVTVNLNVALQVSAGDASGDRLSKIEDVVGSAQADTLIGDKNSNFLFGGGGADTLLGGSGFLDLLSGDAGIDTASYATSGAAVTIDLLAGTASGGDASGDILSGIENLIGTNFADKLTGDDNIVGNKLEGGKGNDTLTGGADADVLDGGEGIDTANYADSDKGVTVNLATNVNKNGTAEGDSLSNIENLIGSENDDTLTGDANANKLEGGEGDDTLTSGAGNDWLLGGNGKDEFMLAGDLTALDKIDGGIGADTLFLAGDYAAGVDFSATTVVSVETIEVADGNSYKLKLSNSTNSSGITVDGDALTGANTLFLDGSLETSSPLAATGGAGGDTLIGGNGSDQLTGGDGDDALTGNGGNDLLTGGAGKDTMAGGAGIDTATYAASGAGVTVDLTLAGAQTSGGDASGDVLSGIENLIGSGQDDALTGDGTANLLVGGKGADTLTGGLGIDTASYADAGAGVTVDLSNSANNADDEAQGDVLSGIENLIGSGDADDLRGDGNNNRIDGGDGSDDLTGNGGVDTLNGGDGDDQFFFAGDLTKDDRLSGGGGDDVLFLDGNYAAGLVFEAATATSLRAIILGDGNSYNLKLNNATNSDELSVNGSGLTGANKLTLDGSAESTHDLTASGGDAGDVIIGGGGDDRLSGNGGADKLTGNGGSDTAAYTGSALAVQVNLNTKGAQVSTGDASGDVLAGIENVSGSGFDDLLTGDKNANVLSGLDGLDTLIGGDGADILNGGADADTLNGGAGSDSASYEGGAGVTASLDDSSVNTGDAAGDVYDSIENLIGSDSADTLIGNGDANKLTGGKGGDTLIADCGLDTVSGGDDDDILDLGHDFTALDRIDGGDGTDTLRIDGNYSLGVTLSSLTMVRVEAIEIADGNSYKFTLADASNPGDLTIDGSVLTGANWLFVNGAAEGSGQLHATGGTGSDTLTGGKGADELAGGAGNDSLTGGNGNDELDGGAGNDSLNGGEGNDLLKTGTGIDLALAGGGIDVIEAGASLTSADRIDGGLGDDTLVLDGDYAGGIVFTTTTVTNVETILLEDNGSYKLTLNDATVAATATLTVDASQLTGGNALNFNGAPEKSGSLVLLGGDGADTLIGGGGIDAFGGSLGADVINGGGNIDVLSYENSAAGVTIDLTKAGAQGGGGDGAGDVISNIENLIGSAHDDDLTGNAVANLIVGGDGKDTIDGGGGNDTVSYLASDLGVTVDLSQILQGGDGHAAGDELTNVENVIGSDLGDHITGNAGNNVLEGRGGHDTLVGGDGNDTMSGGSGTDTYAWFDAISGKDTITDFDSGVDVLDISDLLDGFDPLTSGAEEFVRFLQSGGDTTVQLDVDGKVGGTDFVTLVTLKGVTATVEGFVFNGSLDLTP